jgi:hypothetical protein
MVAATRHRSRVAAPFSALVEDDMQISNWWCAVLLVPASALAQVSPHRIELIAGDPAARVSPQLRISGPWPNTCVPELLPVFVDGPNIDVSVRQEGEICGQAITQYAVTVDPAAANGFGRAPDGIYRVRFSVKDAASQGTLLAFRVVDMTPASSRRLSPEPGFWAPDVAGEFLTSGSGIGFMIERQGSTLAMTTNTYTLGGNAAWYLSAGTLGRSHFNGDLLRSIGGQPLWGTYRGPQSVEPAGSVDIEFSSNSSGVVWYAKASGEGILDPLDLMPVSVQRMNFALPANGEALAGLWLISGTDGSAAAPTSLRLSYQRELSSAREAVLADSAKGYQMRCTIDAARADAAPANCRLTRNGTPAGEFDNNGLSRLSGRGLAGEALVMVRIGD